MLIPDDEIIRAFKKVKMIRGHVNLYQVGDAFNNLSVDRVQTSEYLAWTAAIALLYPVEFHEADRLKIDAEETTLAKVGLHHSVPAFQIENALNHHHIFSMYEQA